MKKIAMIFALFAAMTCTTTAFAQSVKIGVTAGMNVSKLTKGITDSDHRYGYYVGPKLKISLPLGFGLDASALYNQRRFNLETPTGSESETFHSIEIPINVRYNIGLGDLAAVYFATGPQFGFNVGDNKWKHMDSFKTENMNTTWNIGAGVTLIKHLEVGIGYNIALSKYGEGKYAGKNYDFKANTTQVYLTYIF